MLRKDQLEDVRAVLEESSKPVNKTWYILRLTLVISSRTRSPYFSV